MADDLATLGLAVDSKPVDDAAASLEAFSASAQRAAKSADSFSASAGSAGKGQTGFSSQTQKVLNDLSLQQERLTMGGRAYAQFSEIQKAGVSASSAAGLAIAASAGKLYDLQHAGENAGESLFQQRIKFRALAGAVSEGDPALGRMVQQMGLLTIGSQHLTPSIIGSAVAIGLFAGAGAKLVATMHEMAELQGVGSIVGIDNQVLQGLEAAAAGQGILGSKFLDDMTNFAKQVELAKNGMGSLAQFMAVNHIQASGTADAFLKVADSIMNAREGAERLELLQQAGLPATAQMANFMAQGSVEIQRQADAASKFTNQQIRDAAQLEKRYNEVWESIAKVSKTTLVGIADKVNELYNMKPAPGGFQDWLQRLAGTGIYNVDPRPLAAARTPITSGSSSAADERARSAEIQRQNDLLRDQQNKYTQNFAAIQHTLQLEQQRVGILGQTASVNEQVLDVTNKIRLAQMAEPNLNITPNEIANLQRLARERALNIEQIKTEADTQMTQAQAYNMTAGAAAAFTAVQNKLNEASRSGQILTAADITQLTREANAMGAVVAQAEKIKMAKEISFGRQTMFLTPEDVQIATQLKGIYPDVATAMGSVEAAALRMNTLMSAASQQISSGLTSALVSVVNHSATAAQAFRNFGLVVVNALAEMIIKLAIVGPLMRAIGFGFGGGGVFGANAADFGGPGVGTGGFNFLDAKAANGMVFANDNVSRFAAGDIVNSPTLFRFGAGGSSLGVMGEAGPEAVMPLMRGPDGKLGIRGGGTVINNNYITQDFRGVDPSMRAFISAQIQISAAQNRRAAVVDVANTRRDNPSYLVA